MDRQIRRSFFLGLGAGLALGIILMTGLTVFLWPVHSSRRSPAVLASPTVAAGPSSSHSLPMTPVDVTETVVPSITSTPVPTSATQVLTYVVQQDDSLWAIAARFSVTVRSLEIASKLETETIYPGQVLTIPPAGQGLGASPVTDISPLPSQEVSSTVIWHPSVLEGDLASAYPATLEMDRFTLHYTPGTYPARDPQVVVDMITRGLLHIEETYASHLDGHFDVYVAGSLFAPPDQALRGRSFSAARYLFFLHDGTGNQADQQYIVTHELTHLFMWNVFGHPVSAMLSEGAAVYTGMSLIADSEHMPIAVFCRAYQLTGRLPRVSSNLSFQGHIRDLENYYAAGCFVQYLVETYGPEKFGQLYSTGDYGGIYAKSLPALEEEWRADLEVNGPSVPFDPGTLIGAVEAVGDAYDELFAHFTGTMAEMSA